MKKLFLLIFFLPGIINSQTVFQKTYSDGQNISFSDAVATSDGGYIAEGQSGDSTIGHLILKLDANGAVIWSKKISTWSVGETMGRIGESGDGGYFACGISADSNYFGCLNMVKLDNAGNILWNKAYNAGSGRSLSRASCRQNSSGDFFLSAEMGDSLGEFLFVAKTDQNGELLWSKSVTDTLYQKNYCFDVEYCDDGGCIVVGEISYTYAYAAKLDSAGSVEWAKRYSPQAGGILTGEGITRSSGNCFLITGKYNFGSIHCPFVMKIDITGNVVWGKYYTSTGNLTYGHDIETTSDNGFVVLTSQYQVGSSEFIELIKLDSLGKNGWGKFYYLSPYPWMLQCGLHTTPDAGYIIAATLPQDAIGSLPKGYLIKTDSSASTYCYDAPDVITDSPLSIAYDTPLLELAGGSVIHHIHTETISGVSVSTNCSLNAGLTESESGGSGYSVYPNPVISSVTFSFQNLPADGERTLEILDISGRTLSKNNFQADSFILERNGLAAGIYFWRLNCPYLPSLSGKLIVQ
ncbi:MAG: T9SS type A sorting domain-containing protein [Bacteroidia bacterium]